MKIEISSTLEITDSPVKTSSTAIPFLEHFLFGKSATCIMCPKKAAKSNERNTRFATFIYRVFLFLEHFLCALCAHKILISSLFFGSNFPLPPKSS